MNRALFLDRDGVVNHDPGGYTHRKESFIFTDGIFDLCRSFLQAGFLIFVITNQAGIAKGYYSENDFHELTEWMVDQFMRNGVHITKVYYCPYHKEAVIAEYRQDSYDRKPQPGMILRARDEFSLDLSRSVLIGDKINDLKAGKAAGVGLNIIIGESAQIADLSFSNVRSALVARIWECQ